MWLINTRTLQLEEVLDPDSVAYAALSHTWGASNDEVSHQEFHNLEEARKKPGFAKIEKTCKIAQSEGLEYAWVDTCCIDKTNSAELSEAINSMYRWYEESAICYAFLEDMLFEDAKPDDPTPSPSVPSREGEYRRPVDRSPLTAALANCRWFSRGWTLQELIAPRTLRFYDAFWTLVAEKSAIAKVLEAVTGIDEAALIDSTTILSYRVYERMSWASQRSTTRIEDMAYCLLGIFGINFPLLYGEGYKAFARLQEEIIRKTGDPSILAWCGKNPPPRRFRPPEFAHWSPSSSRYRGVLAWSPSEFPRAASARDSSRLLGQPQGVRPSTAFASLGFLRVGDRQNLILEGAAIITYDRWPRLMHSYAKHFLVLPHGLYHVYRELARATHGHYLTGPSRRLHELEFEDQHEYYLNKSLTLDLVQDTSTAFQRLVEGSTRMLHVNFSVDIRTKKTSETIVPLIGRFLESSSRIFAKTRPRAVWPFERWSEVDRTFVWAHAVAVPKVTGPVKLWAIQTFKIDLRALGAGDYLVELACLVGATKSGDGTWQSVTLTRVRSDELKCSSQSPDVLDNLFDSKEIRIMDSQDMGLILGRLERDGKEEETLLLAIDPAAPHDRACVQVRVSNHLQDRQSISHCRAAIQITVIKAEPAPSGRYGRECA